MCKFLSFLIILLTAPLYGQLATITVDSTPTYKVPNDFLGLSLEWDNATYGGRAQALMGTTATGVDTIFRQLLTNISPVVPMPIRIGGNSTSMFVTPDDVTAFAQLNVAKGTTFWLGLNQVNATQAQAVAQASSYYAAMPAGSIRGFEIGNEPDDYTPAWSFTHYQSSLSSLITAVQSVVPGVKFMYPSCGYFWCRDNSWNLPGLYLVDHTMTSANSLHYYPTDSSKNPASGYLLTYAAYSQLARYQYASNSAHRAGNLFRVGEMNSASTGGATGVSNAFESALWMLDTLSRLASFGVDGVNIEGSWLDASSALYDPARIKLISGNPNTFSLIQVRPIYYGMQAFQEAMGSGTPLAYPTNTTAGTSGLVDSFDFIDSSGVERAVIVNRDTVNAGNVNITPLSTHTSATVCYLSASTYSVTSGITLCGQTYDGSTDGTIQGIKSTTTVNPSSGIYSVSMGTAQAAIVQFN